MTDLSFECCVFIVICIVSQIIERAKLEIVKNFRVEREMKHT